MRTRLRWLFAIIAVTLPAASAWGVEGLESLRERHGIAIDGKAISVSGLSSGGYMAGQFHMAHSGKLIGAGIVAAGPYACARTDSFWCDLAPGWPGFWMPADSCPAVHMCTATADKEFGLLGFYFGPPGSADALRTALEEAEAGGIDPLDRLSGDRVWIFSGAEDDLVPPEIVDDLHDFYTALFNRQDVANPAGSIVYERDVPAAHAMVIDVPRQPDNCGYYGPPFINDCDFDAAGKLLAFIHGLQAPAPPEPGPWTPENLFAFDQTPFFDTKDASISLNAEGHVYIPDGCRDGAACALHVAFHGCRQHEAAVIEACGGNGDCPALHFFFRDAGYNAWAEAHDIVVLYPQTTAWGEADDIARNPRGCWDWWGYSGDDYFRKSGKQIQAVDRMIECLRGTRPCQ